MADPAAPQSPDDREQQKLAQRWIAELNAAEKHWRPWVERSKKIAKLYERQDAIPEGDTRKRFAILWSNTETLKPAVYARTPEPVVSRRFDDADPVARVASEVLERALSTSIDLQDFGGALEGVRDDFLLVGRGVTWERYKPTHGPQVTPQIDLQPVTWAEETDSEESMEGQEADAYEDGDGNRYEGEQIRYRDDGSAYALGEPYRPVIYEESVTDYVVWEDFGVSVARTWAEVQEGGFVYRRVFLDRAQLIDRFGQLGKVIPLDWGPQLDGGREPITEVGRKAAVYEIWDACTKKVYWVSKAWISRPLDVRDDPLKLPGFFPCPCPLLATHTTKSLIPTPDYAYYQGQAAEIDKLTGRIGELQDALKVRGFYAGDGKTNLNQLLNAPNNMLIPVPDWLRLKEGGGARGMVEWWPIDVVVTALNALIEQRQQLINDVYQITGVADVLRGMNDPRATATAERIKGAWGTLRVRTKQVAIQDFARDALRIKAAVIAGRFDAETLKKISGVKLLTQAEKQALEGQLAQQAQMMSQAMAQPPPAPAPGPLGMPPGPTPAPNPMMGHNGGPPMAPAIPPDVQEMLANPTWEDVIALLRDQADMLFRIDVETDSTVEPDESEQKAAANELLTAVGTFIAAWGPQVQAQPALAPLAAGMLRFAIRRYRAGRELETLIEQTMQQIQAAPSPTPAEVAKPEAPDTTPIAVQQLKNQGEQIKQAAETDRAQMQAQVDVRGQDIDAEAQRLKLVVGARDPNPQVVA